MFLILLLVLLMVLCNCFFCKSKFFNLMFLGILFFVVAAVIKVGEIVIIVIFLNVNNLFLIFFMNLF